MQKYDSMFFCNTVRVVLSTKSCLDEMIHLRVSQTARSQLRTPLMLDAIAKASCLPLIETQPNL